ncbi:hypothetical protein [Aequorivita lipolytica]|uniref:Uncharacterized protein n=1 Tax=Aequorivita lipolytica TaxID=153267 RepID=A0A5C6YS97_9FLAO|nr:hypothetical protein [Aequorivita lipolytica]TXD70278.1 hypothetical protein ESV24_03700 [Aequorivita lipolytica]SRX50705.1 hypothetical protein AEQU2_01181 [Aequorivita lipolytica]
MKTVFSRMAIFVTILFFATSCENRTLQENLNTGLLHYKKVRFINRGFIDGYGIEKIAFFKEQDSNYTFVLKMYDNAVNDTVEKYRLGIVFFPEGDTLAPFSKWWFMEPTMKKVGKYKYVIEKVFLPYQKLDSIRLFLTDRKGYNGVKGNVLNLKNLRL